jgi:hypothetical protein
MDPNDKRVIRLRMNDDTTAFAGYTLFTPAASITTSLVDMQGQVCRAPLKPRPYAGQLVSATSEEAGSCGVSSSPVLALDPPV